MKKKNIEISADAISKRAYELYMARGCEEGYATEDWLKAEAELKAELEKNSRESASKKTKAAAPKVARKKK